MSEEEDRIARRNRQRLLNQLEEDMVALQEQRRFATLRDYVYDKTQEAYWDLVDGKMYGEEAVDASIPQELWRVEIIEAPERAEGARGPQARERRRPVRPSMDIRRVENDQFVECSTWWPGKGQIIKDVFVDSDGSREMKGARTFNTYRPPPRFAATKQTHTTWVNHVKMLFPDPEEHEHFFNICAHMLQRPDEKCNTCVVLSGSQGIGKDATMAPLKAAVGIWNCKDIEPDELFTPYRPWLESKMIIVNEVRPNKEEFRSMAVYNALKPIIAAPPDTLPLNDKYAKIRHVQNVATVFITTNDWMSMFIPEDDRRMFIMNSKLKRDWVIKDNRPDYFVEYWAWLNNGGTEAVANFLLTRDISKFNSKNAPPKTATQDSIVASWDDSEDAVGLALDEMNHPEVFLLPQLLDHKLDKAGFDRRPEIETLMKSPRKLAHRLHSAGYHFIKPISRKWEFEGPLRRLQTKSAFVRADLEISREVAYQKIRNEGNRLCGKEVVVEMIPRNTTVEQADKPPK